MPPAFPQVEVGSTIQLTWVASSAPATLGLQVKTASETVVASLSAVQSGGGSWYAFVTIPDSFGRYPADLAGIWTATASTHAGNSSPFITTQLFQVTKTTAFGQPRS